MEGGDLRTRNSEVDPATRRRVFSWYGRGRCVALDVACALHFLHTSSYTHFDIKSRWVPAPARRGWLPLPCLLLLRLLLPAAGGPWRARPSPSSTRRCLHTPRSPARSNVLLSRDLTAKVCDVGFTRVSARTAAAREGLRRAGRGGRGRGVG